MTGSKWTNMSLALTFFPPTTATNVKSLWPQKQHALNDPDALVLPSLSSIFSSYPCTHHVPPHPREHCLMVHTTAIPCLLLTTYSWKCHPTYDTQGDDKKAGVWVRDAPKSLPIFLLGPKESDVDRPRQRLSRDSPLISSKGQAPLLKASPLQ